MPYALIPDNYTLKKVTPAQEAAVHSKRRHDDVVAFLSNENTPPLLGGGALLALTPFLLDIFKSALETENIILTDKQKDNLKKAFDIALISTPLTQPFVLGKKAADFVQETLK